MSLTGEALASGNRNLLSAGNLIPSGGDRLLVRSQRDRFHQTVLMETAKYIPMFLGNTQAYQPLWLVLTELQLQQNI